ncbi:MAG TPA: hypothetical protein VM163_07460 [bacterium]|nr:hypothetical protein [bacterium]
MSKERRTACFILLAFLLGLGCAHIPKSDNPAQIERTISTSFERTWHAVTEVVTVFKGAYVTMNHDSGLIVFSLTPDRIKKLTAHKTEEKVFVQVHIVLPAEHSQGRTFVYVFARTRSGYYAGAIDSVFFDELDRRLSGK